MLDEAIELGGSVDLRRFVEISAAAARMARNLDVPQVESRYEEPARVAAAVYYLCHATSYVKQSLPESDKKLLKKHAHLGRRLWIGVPPKWLDSQADDSPGQQD